MRLGLGLGLTPRECKQYGMDLFTIFGIESIQKPCIAPLNHCGVKLLFPMRYNYLSMVSE